MALHPYTIWTNQPLDLKPGRWVQKGYATQLNWWLTGLPGGKFWFQSTYPWIKYQPCQVHFQDHYTVWLDPKMVKWPQGFGLDGWCKGLIGQRQIA